jgi:hypothetical protein
MLTRASRSSVFNLAFFHSLVGLGRGVDDGDDSGADPSASLRVLVFPAPVFELLDGDAFILQVHGVFTRIRSGATLAADCGSASRSNLKHGGGGVGSRAAVEQNVDLFKWLLLRGMKNPKGLNACLKPNMRQYTD